MGKESVWITPMWANQCHKHHPNSIHLGMVYNTYKNDALDDGVLLFYTHYSTILGVNSINSELGPLGGGYLCIHVHTFFCR